MSDESKNQELETATDAAPTAAQEDSTTSLESEITHLRQQLAANELEAKSNLDRFMRQAAELENFKKRMTRERDEAIRFANEVLIKDLLPVVDNLERALAHAAGPGSRKPLVEGVEMVLKGFLDVFAKHSVSPVASVGKSFDPSRHEAIAQVESATNEPNTVVAEHQKGYLCRERLLRPALVTVAKTSKTNDKKNDGSKVENDLSDD
jgi:molecular chaperone GrpE